VIAGPWPLSKDETHHVVPLEKPYLTPLFLGQRVALRVNHRDALKLRRGPGFFGIITDLDTKKRYELHGRPCPVPNCYCDAEIIEVTTSG